MSLKKKKDLNPMSVNNNWLDLLLAGYLYSAFLRWFFSKTPNFRTVLFLILFVVSWIWVLCDAPGK
jgi:hypothetical protein